MSLIYLATLPWTSSILIVKTFGIQANGRALASWDNFGDCSVG